MLAVGSTVHVNIETSKGLQENQWSHSKEALMRNVTGD